jgi:UDP-3-O-[3-hydroxymyristoyl] N-acetylglucosamine deacetylase
MKKQQTLRHKVSCKGIGLHSGKPVTMTLKPAEIDSGIVFKRLDVAREQSLIPARFDAVCDTRLGTRLVNSHGMTVSTVEHLMAALWGAGVDNAQIELDGPEVPIMDGSSEPFLFLIECAGVAPQNAARKILRVIAPVEVTDGTSSARLLPNEAGNDGLVLSVEIDFNHPTIKRQKAVYDFRDTTFKQALSRARTFGFEHEVEALRSGGLALGGSLENAIVLGKDGGILNQGGLRFSDEFVRHKALDCIGDFFLAGLSMDARAECVRPGHGINNKLLRALFADESAFIIESADSAAIPANIPLYRAAFA